MLSTAQVHSVTDQTDFRLLPAIAAAAPMAVTPEQSALWAYPGPDMSDGETAFTLASALLGRVHLSGRIDLLRPAQSELTADALAAYRVLRPHLNSARPHWPLGLPAWRDGWVALALESEVSGPAAHVLVWRRDGEGGAIRLPMPWLRDRRGLDARIVFPASSEAVVAWEQESRTLSVELPQPWSAVLLSLKS
jgi:alpha-galactosidase